MKWSKQAQRFSAPEESLEPRVTLVLGTAARLVSGRHNLYFLGRMDMAAELYHTGKILHLILSGDNSRKSYNEPEDMRQALLERGVPDSLMALDFTGFRTLDSVVRIQKVFQQEKITIISQGFHLARACFIARQKGLDAQGYEAPFITLSWVKLLLRESMARVKMVLDLYIFQTGPKYLGPPITL
ncbi:MAG: ElyC/SanA/YdcF family protein [Bacteroidota bacterium]